MIEIRFFKGVDRICNILIQNGYSNLSKNLGNAAYGNIMPSEVLGETEITLKKIQYLADKNKELDEAVENLLKYIDNSFQNTDDR